MRTPPPKSDIDRDMAALQPQMILTCDRKKKGPREAGLQDTIRRVRRLSGAVTSGVEAGDHGPTVTVVAGARLSARRIKPRLRHRPLVALVAIARLLLLGLYVTRVHVDIPHGRTGRRRCAARPIRRRGTVGWRCTVRGWRTGISRGCPSRRRRIRHDVAIVRGVPRVIDIVRVVVRNS